MIDKKPEELESQREAQQSLAPVSSLRSALDYSPGYSSAKSLTDYPVLIFRHWPIIAIMVVIGVALAMYQTSRTPRLYRSSAMLNIGTYVPPLEGPTSASLRQETSTRNYRNTQIRLLKSITLAEKVLEGNSEVFQFLDRRSYEKRNASKGTQELPVHTMQKYLNLVTFHAIPQTDLVMVYATTTSPTMSARIANAHVNGFINLVKERRQSTANVNLKFLQERYDEATAKLTSSERKLLKHVKKYSLGVTSNKLLEETFSNKYRGLVNSLNEAISSKTALESQYKEIRRTRGLGQLDGMRSLEGEIVGLSKLENQYAQRKKRVRSLSDPMLRDLKENIESTRSALRQAGKLRLKEAKNKYLAASERERFLRTEFDKLHKEQVEISKHRVEKDSLAQEVQSFKEVQASLAKRLEDAMVNAHSQQDTVTLVDKAFAASGHISPNERSNIWTGGILGCILGIMIVFLLDYVDNRVRTVNDLQSTTRTPVLGVVPEFSKEALKLSKSVARKKNSYYQDGKGTAIVESDEVFDAPTPGPDSDPSKAPTVVLGKNSPILPVSAPFSAESESFRGILATLTSAGAEIPKSILVTSGQQGDGKTTLAVNLAATLAQMSEKTLLIDADLRLPNVQKYFGLQKNHRGLSDLLTDDVPVEDLIVNGGLPELSLLLAGTPTPNPARLVRSDKMATFLDEMLKEYDYVIVDSAPIGPVADSLLLAQHVDGVAVVIRSGETSKSVAESAVARLRQVGANVLGLVLNDTQRKEQYWKKGYQYYNRSRRRYI